MSTNQGETQCFTLKGSHGNKSWRRNDWIPFFNCQLSPFFGYFRGHCQIREIPQNYHRFAWFDPPQMGDLMTPVFTINNLDFTSIQLVILIPARYQSSADPGRVQRWKHGKRNFEKKCERSSQYEVEICLLPCHIFVGKRIYLRCIAKNLWTLKQQRRRSSPLRSPRSWGNFLETAVATVISIVRFLYSFIDFYFYIYLPVFIYLHRFILHAGSYIATMFVKYASLKPQFSRFKFVKKNATFGHFPPKAKFLLQLLCNPPPTGGTTHKIVWIWRFHLRDVKP